MITQCGSYAFDFTPTGYFTLVDSNGEPFYEKALPLFQKLISHFLYIFFWSSLLLLHLPQIFGYIWMSFIFVHLFLIGARLTSLMLIGGFKPILFPPLYVRLTRKLHKTPSINLLEKHGLHTHAGLLTNLAIIQHRRKDPQALSTLKKALSEAPNHPYLNYLLENLNNT